MPCGDYLWHTTRSHWMHSMSRRNFNNHNWTSCLLLLSLYYPDIVYSVSQSEDWTLWQTDRQTHTHTETHTQTFTYTHTYTHTHIHIYPHIHTHTHTLTQTQIKYTYTYTLTHWLTYIYTQTLINYTHIPSHTLSLSLPLCFCFSYTLCLCPSLCLSCSLCLCLCFCLSTSLSFSPVTDKPLMFSVCALGYSLEPNTHICKPCQFNTFSDSVGHAPCTHCPQGMVTGGTGSTSIQDCCALTNVNIF